MIYLTSFFLKCLRDQREWPSGMRCYTENWQDPAQTPLGVRSGFGTQPRYYALDNSPKLGCWTAKQQSKKLTPFPVFYGKFINICTFCTRWMFLLLEFLELVSDTFCLHAPSLNWDKASHWNPEAVNTTK